MGDLSAMRPAIELLRGTYPSWVRTARSIVGPDEAEDVVQQALVEVLRRYPDFSGLEHPAGYIRVVVVRSAWRHQRGRADVPTQNLSELLEGEGQADGEVADILPLLRQLAPKQRACVFLKVVYGLSDREIASVLACKPVTVRTQVTRGLRSLGVTITSNSAGGLR